MHACGQLSISGAVSEWYFAIDKSRDSGSVFAAMQRALRYHAGTAACGALIVSIVEALRCVISFYINRTKRLNKSSAAFKVLSCCANCCMGVLERIAHFASEMAYIQTAMHGTNFCSSAAASFSLVARNTMNITVLSGVSGAIMLIGKLFIAFGTTLVSLFIFNGGTDVLTNTKQFQSLPCLVVFLLAYAISSFFLGVFESCIDTIFQCFCEDSERHSGKFTGQDPKPPLPLQPSSPLPSVARMRSHMSHIFVRRSLPSKNQQCNRNPVRLVPLFSVVATRQLHRSSRLRPHGRQGNCPLDVTARSLIDDVFCCS